MLKHTLVLALLLAGCDDNVYSSAQPAVSTTGYQGVLDVADNQCIGCHAAANPLGGLDLETDFAAATVDVVGAYGQTIVVPGDAGASFLYQKITNNQGSDGGEMPPGTGGLSAEEADIILNWIDDGAPTE